MRTFKSPQGQGIQKRNLQLLRDDCIQYENSYNIFYWKTQVIGPSSGSTFMSKRKLETTGDKQKNDTQHSSNLYYKVLIYFD